MKHSQKKTRFLIFILSLNAVVFGFVEKTSAAPIACPKSHPSEIVDTRTQANQLVRKLNVVSAGHFSNYDEYPNFNYDSFQNILFLSDGGKAGRALESTKKPSQLVVSSDFNISPGINIKIDNNQLPFRQNSFDLIVMNRGLCPCRGTVACGGIDTQREPMKKFLTEVVEVLDKNNPHSLALITGFYFPGLYRKVVPQLWMSIVRELQNQYPHLKFALLQRDRDFKNLTSGFMGIVISANSEMPIEESLLRLRDDLVLSKTSTPEEE